MRLRRRRIPRHNARALGGQSQRRADGRAERRACGGDRGANLARRVRRRPRPQCWRGCDRLRIAGRRSAAQETVLRADRQEPASGVDHRDRLVGPVDRRDGARAKRIVPAQFSRRPSVQSAARDRRHRSYSGTRHRPGCRQERRRDADEAAGAQGDRHQGHAGVRRQPGRLQGLERNRATGRRARRRVHRLSDRAAYRARDGAAGDRRSGRMGRAQGDRR